MHCALADCRAGWGARVSSRLGELAECARAGKAERGLEVLSEATA